MKRRITSMLLAAAMTITMLTGCGSQGKETEKTDTGAIVLDMYQLEHRQRKRSGFGQTDTGI